MPLTIVGVSGWLDIITDFGGQVREWLVKYQGSQLAG